MLQMSCPAGSWPPGAECMSCPAAEQTGSFAGSSGRHSSHSVLSSKVQAPFQQRDGELVKHQSLVCIQTTHGVKNNPQEAVKGKQTACVNWDPFLQRNRRREEIQRLTHPFLSQRSLCGFSWSVNRGWMWQWNIWAAGSTVSLPCLPRQ